jgi:hypothetical protein
LEKVNKNFGLCGEETNDVNNLRAKFNLLLFGKAEIRVILAYRRWVRKKFKVRPAAPPDYDLSVIFNITAKIQYRKFETNILRKGIARARSQFPHSYAVSDLFLCRKICGLILEIGTEAAQFLF